MVRAENCTHLLQEGERKLDKDEKWGYEKINKQITHWSRRGKVMILNTHVQNTVVSLERGHRSPGKGWGAWVRAHHCLGIMMEGRCSDFLQKFITLGL